MDLNDELTHREHADLRDRVTGGVGRMRATRVRRSRIVAGAAAVALVGVVVSGVAFAALRPDGRTAHPIETTTVAPTPTPSRTPSLTPDPDPTPDPATDARSPIIALGGSCDDVLQLGDLSAAIGVQFDAPGEGFTTEVRTLGGIDCRWWSSEGAGVLVYAYPIEVVSSARREAYASPVCEGYLYDGSGCRVALENEHTWMLVTADSVLDAEGYGVDEPATLARLDAVTPLARQALASAPDPRPAAETSEWWSIGSCEMFGGTIPIAEILGSREFVSGYPSGFGTDVSTEIARDAGFGFECRWYVPESDQLDAVIFRLHPGAAWDWGRISTERDNAEIVNVPGASEAFVNVGAIRPDSMHLVATDGVNVIEVMEAPDVVRAAELALAALNGAP